MLSIELDQRELQRWISAAGKQLPYATMVALNRTAKRDKVEARKEMTQVFDRPRPYTLNSLMTHSATKTNQEAIVWVKDERRGGVPPANFIGPQILGGNAMLKPMN